MFGFLLLHVLSDDYDPDAYVDDILTAADAKISSASAFVSQQSQVLDAQAASAASLRRNLTTQSASIRQLLHRLVDEAIATFISEIPIAAIVSELVDHVQINLSLIAVTTPRYRRPVRLADRVWFSIQRTHQVAPIPPGDGGRWVFPGDSGDFLFRAARLSRIAILQLDAADGSCGVRRFGVEFSARGKVVHAAADLPAGSAIVFGNPIWFRDLRVVVEKNAGGDSVCIGAIHALDVPYLKA
jgi:hypothetical protein